MTAQAPDLLIIDGRPFSITAVEGDGLFAPSDFGLRPQPMSTACYRGYVVTYAVTDGRLVIAELRLGSAEWPATLGGAEARLAKDEFVWSYHGMAIRSDFTGRVLVGDGEVPGTPYLNMGFWPAWMYAVVYELHFDRRLIVEQLDRTAEATMVRDGTGDLAFRRSPHESTKDWIDRTFFLTFAYNWPEGESFRPR